MGASFLGLATAWVIGAGAAALPKWKSGMSKWKVGARDGAFRRGGAVRTAGASKISQWATSP